MARTRDFAEYIRAQMAADPELAAAVEEETVNVRVERLLYDLAGVPPCEPVTLYPDDIR